MAKTQSKLKDGVVVYFLSNLLIIIAVVGFFVINAGLESSYNCYQDLGSFRTHACSLGEYLSDNLILVFLFIYIPLQLPLIISAAIIGTLKSDIDKQLPKKWMAYPAAISLHIIAAIIITSMTAWG